MAYSWGGDTAAKGKLGNMTQIDRFYTLLDEGDYDPQAWQAARETAPACAMSALRAAVSLVINESRRPADDLADVIYGLAFTAGEGSDG